MYSVDEIASILESIPGGYRTSKDRISIKANKRYFGIYKKLGVIADLEEIDEKVNTAPDDNHGTRSANKCNPFYCNEHGCNQKFQNVADFQSHFNNSHRFLCNECKRALPTAHLLDLHLSEQHDSYFAACLARGTEPMYACFLEECPVKSLSVEARKDHCISEHNFPANYRYFQFKNKATEEHNNKNKNQLSQDTMAEPEGTQTNAMNEKQPCTQTRNKAFSFGHHAEIAFNKAAKNEHKAKVSVTPLEDLHTLKNALERLD